MVLGPEVAPPDGVDGLVCVDGSLRPEPPPPGLPGRIVLLAAAC